MTSVQFLLASALALLLFLTFANLVVVQYGRGALRSALEQGVRAASMTGSVDACEATIETVISDLLGGLMAEDFVFTCSVEPTRVIVEAVGSFESWSLLTPDFEIAMHSEAFREVAP